MKLRILVLWLALFGYCSVAGAQTIPVGLLDNTEDYYRRQQLIGKDIGTSSFMIRPLHNVSDSSLNRVLWKNDKESIVLSTLPAIWQQQYNTHHPYGMNDGAMILAKGYETLISTGTVAKIGPLRIQFMPQMIYAQNSSFRGVADAGNTDKIKELYFGLNRRIDLPERFGDGSYSKFSWGQSSIRLNAGPVSLGLSNENLWWGPGRRSSLLMTNNAGGFKHFTLNTLRPVRTPVGSFEAQIIGGKLEATGLIPKFTVPRPKDWRYLSGINVNYQPKWIPGLFFGFERAFIIYSKDLGTGFDDYLPFLSAFTKKDSKGPSEEDTKARNQLIAISVKWVLPEAKAEIYMEYGREDHAANLRDGVTEPEHSRAYVFGFRKLIELEEPDAYISAGLELTKTGSPTNSYIRNAASWYTHSQVRDGYTQEGQVLGVGLDPGSNLQTFDVSLVKGWNVIGLQVERYVHNNTLYEKELFVDKGDRNPWVDFGLTAKYDKEYKRFIFNSQLTYIKSSNYQWAVDEDASNLQLRIGVMYRW